MKQLILLILCCLLVGGHSLAETSQTKFGKVWLEQPAKKVLSALGKPDKKGERHLEGATGYTIEPWEYSDLGLSLQMAEPEDSNKQTVYRIEVKSPCKWSGWNGIGIGTPAHKVKSFVSKKQINPKNEVSISDDSCSVLMTESWTMLVFSIKNGKVKEIFLGPGPE